MNKNFLSIFLLLVSFVGFSQNLREKVVVKTPIYTCVYSEKLEQPLNVKYTVQCPDGTASRKGMDFYTNDSIHTSDGNDYYNNEWDKGHMAPAADFNCDTKTLYKTFSYLNSALQHQDLNRKTWRLLEAYERELAKKGKVDVEIEVIFSKNSTKLPTGATVPDAFRKTIKLDGKVVGVYFFKNEKPLYNDYEKYRVSQ
jgi:endonuclease G